MVLRRWYPERPPTWTDVLVGLLALLWIPINLASLSTIHWSWTLFGVTMGVVSTGPLANSSIGKRVGRWFRGVGVVGRIVLVLSFATGVWIVSVRVDVPSEIVTSAVGGFVIAMVLYLFGHALHSGEVRRRNE